MLGAYYGNVIPLISPFLPQPVQSKRKRHDDTYSPHVIHTLQNTPYSNLRITTYYLKCKAFNKLKIFTPSASSSGHFITGAYAAIVPITKSLTQYLTSTGRYCLISPTDDRVLISGVGPYVYGCRLVRAIGLQVTRWVDCDLFSNVCCSSGHDGSETGAYGGSQLLRKVRLLSGESAQTLPITLVVRSGSASHATFILTARRSGVYPVGFQ